MAGIEVNPKSVLRTGAQVHASYPRGYNSIPVVSNHQSGLQSPGLDSGMAALASRGYNTRSQQQYVSATQTLPRSPVDTVLSNNLTQTLPTRSLNQKLESQYLKQQQIAAQQQMTSQQLLQQQMTPQQLLQQQMTSQQLLQQQILLRQLKPPVRPPPPSSKQSQISQITDPPGSPVRSSKSVPAPLLSDINSKSSKSVPKQARTIDHQLLNYASAGQQLGNAAALQQLGSSQPGQMLAVQQTAAVSSAANSQLPLAISSQQSSAAPQLSQVTAGQLLQQQASVVSMAASQIPVAKQTSKNSVTPSVTKSGNQQAQLQQAQLQQAQLQQAQLQQAQLQHTGHGLTLQQQELELLLEQHRINEEEMMLAKLQGVRLDGQGMQAGGSATDRTYMNVQPVAVIGRGGKIFNQPEMKQNAQSKIVGGRKAPAIPKSQEVKHKKEPLYSTILQCSAQDANKINGMNVFDDGVYANYAPASLYSNYSNYSELEALRSTDSQCSADEEPTEGLPSLVDTDSPVSSSYSELRQAALLGGQQRIAFNGDGSIYEPVLPPKGVPGPNSIHFKSLSGGSTDSDFFGSCVKCGTKIVGDGSGCSAMGRLYHVQCFTCTQCGMVLQGLPFYAVEGSPLCEADYLNTLEKCCKCLQPILDRILRATGKPYHPNCFTCVACNKSLDGIPFTVDATNQIHCIEDFHKRFAPRCSVCKDPIMPTPGEEETVRVVALDRSFHINCYRCVDCNLLLSSEEEGRGCYPLDDTVLCRQCNTTRIQKLTSSMAQE